MKVKSPSRVQLLATPWTAAYQAPPPMGFSRQEYWSGVPLPSPKKNTLEGFNSRLDEGERISVLGYRTLCAAAAAKSLQSYPTLCDLMECNPPSFSVHLFMGFSQQEHCKNTFPPPGDLPNPGIKTVSLTSPALAGGFFTTSATWEATI